MKILYRYIFREGFTFFGISLLTFTGVLLTLRMLHFAALIVDKGVSLSQIAQIFVAVVPTFLEIAIPLSALLGIMLAFARLSGDSEVVVMRTSGISLYQLVAPIVVFGLLTAGIGLCVSNVLKPWSYSKLSAALFDVASTRSTSGLEEGIFNKLGPITLYAEQIEDRTGALSRVLIDDRRDRDQRKVVVAKTGKILSDPSERAIVLYLEDGSIHEQVDKSKYSITQFNSNSLTLDPDELFEGNKRQGKATNEMLRAELKEAITYLTSLRPLFAQTDLIRPSELPEPRPASIAPETMSQERVEKRILRLKLELGQRASLPFASFALALLALPLGIQPPRAQRTWGAGISVTLGMIVFVFYYGLFSFGVVMAQAGTIPPWAADWIPNVCVLAFALFAIKKTASEQWQSIAQGFEHGIQVLMRALQRVRSR